MSSEMQMVPVQDTFVPETMDVSTGEAAGGNPLAKVHQYLRGRYLKAILSGVLLAACGAVAGYFIVPLKFTSIGQIQVTSTPLAPLPNSKLEDGVTSNFDGFVDTQVLQLQQQFMIQRAVTNPIWRAVSPIGAKSEGEEIAEFADSLEVYHPPGTELIFVRFRDPDARKAKAGADAVMSAFRGYSDVLIPDGFAERVKSLSDEKQRSQSQITTLQQLIENAAPHFVGNDLLQIHSQTIAALQECEGRVKQYRLAIQGIAATTQPSVPGDVATSRPASELTPELAAELDPEIGRIDLQIEGSHAEIDRLTRRGFGPSSPAIRNLTLDLASLEERRQVRLARLKERLEREPQAAVKTSNGTAMPSIEKLTSDLAVLERMRDDLFAKAGSESKMIRDIETWKGEIATHQKILSDVNTQIFNENFNRPFRILDRRIQTSPASLPPRPDKDRRRMGGIAGGFGGMALGIGIFVLIGFFDRRLRTVADARDSLDRSNRILGILPYLPEDLADPDQSSTAAFCVHHIRTLLQVGGSGTSNSVIAVTSASPGDGKTSLVISLGLSYAATGAKTLLIDSDLIGAGLTSRANAIARRKIGSILLREKRISQEQLDEALDQAHRHGKRLGEVLVDLGYLKQGELDKALSMQQESSLGLLDVLDGEPLSDCVFPGWANNLSILPVGNVGANHAGQMSLRAIRKIISEVRTQYDVVLIDTGPILGSLEACLFAAAVDEVIVAVARDQQRPLVEKTFSRLREVGARIAGIVFNRAPREDIESGGYFSSVVSQRVQSPMIRADATESKNTRMQRLGPVVRAVAGEGPNSGEGL